MTYLDSESLAELHEALEASWDRETSYQGVEKAGRIAYGQCYPTARVVQHYFPESEIIEGKVWTGSSEELHFWNGFLRDGEWHYVDLTWDQFPEGSVVRSRTVLSRTEIVDSETTQKRCALLLQRVRDFLERSTPSSARATTSLDV